MGHEASTDRRRFAFEGCALVPPVVTSYPRHVTMQETNKLSRSAVLGVAGTMSVIFPAFLTGALAVQVKDGLSLSETDFGFAIGAFFIGSTLGSALLGRLAERLGPRSAIRLGLSTTIAANLVIAFAVNSGLTLQLTLTVAGLANALTQPAINLLLVRTVDRSRLGFVMALKQSGMPSAALLGGLAVPAIALTVGWRPAYGFAACMALGALALTGGKQTAALREDTSTATVGTTQRAKPDLGLAMLMLMAAVGVLGGGAANILVGYLVSGAVDAGVGPAAAGLLLTFGAALGVGSRLVHGWLVDRRPFDALTRVVVMFVLGSAGAFALAVHTPVAYLAATPVAFAAGWAWPGLFNLVVVNANRSAPAAATGVTQTGVYLGSLIGPVVAGFLIERSGYPVVWMLTGCALGGAGLAAAAVNAGMRASDKERPRYEVRASVSGR